MPSTRQLNSQYFEAIIQLRPKSRKLLSFVQDQINRKQDVFVSKEIHKKYGTDLYISSRKFAMQLGKRLKKSYNGQLLTSRKLYSRDRQTSKAIYRVTICFRLKQ